MERLAEPQTHRSGRPVIRAADIEKSYGSGLPFTASNRVLSGASLEIAAGEIVGIVGENGSGKSTLMKILVGVLDADAGSLDRFGRIGWCPQESLLYERLTVRETFRLFGSGYGMSVSEIQATMDRLSKRLGFEQYLDYRIDRLSGGNRQKINLSIALMHDPDVLLLDEPYTGFDWATYQTFWDLSAELVESGTAIAIISHLLEERERLDRIYELRDGVLVEATDDEE